jgi:hypothetical protein
MGGETYKVVISLQDSCKNLKVISNCKNSHKWHIATRNHKIDGCKFQDFYECKKL